MSSRDVRTETIRDSDTKARCTKCEWEVERVWTTYETRAARASARRHTASTGHEVMLETERHTTTWFREVRPDGG